MLLPYSKEEYKLGQFLLKKIKLYCTSRNENETRKERVYNNVKIFRCMYLYTNRFLRNNTMPIENMNKMVKNVLKVTLKKSIEYSDDIEEVIEEYAWTDQQIRYMTLTINNIHKFKQLYYNRKTHIATILSAKLPSTDLCRKITTYLY